MLVFVTSFMEGRELDAYVVHGEAMQVSGAAMRDLFGFGLEKFGEFLFEAQLWVFLDDALVDGVGYFVAVQIEHVDGCVGGEEVGFGTGFEADVGGVVHGDRVGCS